MAERLPGVRILLILFLCAAVAAIMSTIDSALLSVSSVFTQDLYKRMRPTVSQHHLTVTGKVFSWGLMAVLVFLAIQLPQTLWRLTEIKLELLCQVAPAIFLGVHLKSLRTDAVLSGAARWHLCCVGYHVRQSCWAGGCNETDGHPRRCLGIGRKFPDNRTRFNDQKTGMAATVVGMRCPDSSRFKAICRNFCKLTYQKAFYYV